MTQLRDHFVFYVSGMVLLLALVACVEAGPTPLMPIPNVSSPTPERTFDKLRQTPVPTLPSLLAQTPVLTPEAGIDSQGIEVSNAAQIANLGKLAKGTILSAPVYSPDGRWLAIPHAAGIAIYDAQTFEELDAVPQATSFIAFSPHGSLLAASGRNTVTLWDLDGLAPVGELEGSPGAWHWEISFSPDGSLLAASTSEREIVLWSVSSGDPWFAVPGDRLQFSSDGDLAVVVTYGENRVQLYDTRSGAEVNHWIARHAGLTPGGQLWLEDADSVRLVYVERNLVTAPFSGVQPSFSADGSLMALFANGQVSLYDHQKGRRTQVLEGRFVQIDGVHFSPDGQTLAGEVYKLRCPTCTEMEGLDRRLVLWRRSDGSIISEREHPSGWIAFSTSGDWLAVARMEVVEFVQTADGSTVDQIRGFAGPIEGMAVSPDGHTLAAVHATEPYTLRLWDLVGRRALRDWQDRQGNGALQNVDVAFSPDGNYLAVGGDLWDLASGKHLAEMERAIAAETSCWSSSLAFSPAGNALATGCFEGQLHLWSVPDGTRIRRVGDYSGWVNDLAYSPDGHSLAAVYGVPDYLVQVWRLPDGEAAFTLTGGHFTRVAYSPDGGTLATVTATEVHEQYGQPAGFVTLWRASNGEQIDQLAVTDAVSMAFSPNSRILATGSLDGTLRLWEIAEGRLLVEARGHHDWILDVAFTSDGTRLVCGSRDGTISLWGIPGPGSPGAGSLSGVWRTYTSDKFGFSIDYPPGWEYLEVPNVVYETDLPQIWFTVTGYPEPQTGSRADIVLIFLNKDPTPDWQAEKFENYESEIIRIGSREALRVSGINKESRDQELAMITRVGEYFVLAIPNGSAQSLEYFDRMLSTLR